MFGIGPMEMGIIAVVALLIFGPEKLPEMMGQAGKMVRDFRKMTAEMSGEFEKTIAEARSVTKEFQGEVGSMRNQVNSVSRSIQNDLGGGKKTGTSKATTSTKRSSSSSAAAKKKTGTSSSTASSRASGSSKTSKSSSSSTASSASTKKTTTTTAAKPAAPQQATREDPTAAISLFEPSAPRRERRARKATLDVFGEATPRGVLATEPVVTAVEDAAGADLGVPKTIDLNDPLARARQRRQSAGYARKIS
jgi:Tat protein translocase TatB subunit